MMTVQAELEAAKVEGSSGGGAVRATVTGKMRLDSITIDPEVISEDVELLEDLVTAAINEALDKAQEMASSKMGAVTGGLNIPGIT
ncbi:MAG: YbaB/EbfC family nucleoid-associated protein [Dehalococcoidia bacterium]|nr:YbaB/EbfC family nucleoid-associated protein [Dehalococcoidia bacterium]MQG16559.1 YbaB/EbfC family nucleoid-associated protein [SAR202 cluster bacterium]